MFITQGIIHGGLDEKKNQLCSGGWYLCEYKRALTGLAGGIHFTECHSSHFISYCPCANLLNVTFFSCLKVRKIWRERKE